MRTLQQPCKQVDLEAAVDAMESMMALHMTIEELRKEIDEKRGRIEMNIDRKAERTQLVCSSRRRVSAC